MTNDQTNGAITLHEPTRAGLAMSFDAMKERVLAIDEFYKGVMQQGTDYDTIPGTPKPTLLQPGAQLLDAIFGLVAKFERLEGTTADYDRGFFAYEIRCALVSKTTQEVMAEGIGSCNSMEGRYRWRESKPLCPTCGFDLRVSRNADEWYCWKAKGGCGATYPLPQFKAGTKVENDDPYTLANTILKMAQKRAHVAATLNATGASRIFTQDVEDMGDLVGSAAPPPRQESPQPPRQAQPRERQQPPRQPAAPAPPPEFIDSEAEDVTVDVPEDLDFGICQELWEANPGMQYPRPPGQNANVSLLRAWYKGFTTKMKANQEAATV
jgi:hypothetical protein